VAEARTGKRFPLELPISIGSKDAPARKNGTTSNVSAAGVYMLFDSELEVGSEVEFDITLPAEVIGSRRDVQIHCRGRVVRSERPSRRRGPGRRNGVACVIDHYRFMRKA